MLRREHALAPLHQAGILCNSKNPRAHVLRLAKLIVVLEDLEQRLLRDFFRILRLPAHHQAVVEDLRSEMFDEPVKGVRLARSQRPGEFDLSGPVQAMIVAPRTEPPSQFAADSAACCESSTCGRRAGPPPRVAAPARAQ